VGKIYLKKKTLGFVILLILRIFSNQLGFPNPIRILEFELKPIFKPFKILKSILVVSRWVGQVKKPTKSIPHYNCHP
jgi:hypothetical protein